MRPLVPAFFVLALSASALGQEEVNSSKIDEINARYDAEYKKIESEADELDNFDPSKVGAVVGIDVEITSKRVEFSFDTPSVDMKRRDIVMHLPQVAMRTKEMSFDIPEFEWGTTEVLGVSLDLPKIYSKRVSFSMDIPEFTWDTTTIKMDVPEFYMHTNDFSFDIPEVKIVDVSEEIDEIEQKSAELQARSETLVAQQKEELVGATGEMFDEIGSKVVAERDKALADLDAAIVQLSDAITKVEYYSMDPRKVRNQDGTQTDLVAQLDELKAQRQALWDQIQVSLDDIAKRREEAIAGIKEEA